MHTMQENHGEHHDITTNGYAESVGYGSGPHPQAQHSEHGLRDTLLSVVGMLLPLLAQLGHAH